MALRFCRSSESDRSRGGRIRPQPGGDRTRGSTTRARSVFAADPRIEPRATARARVSKSAAPRHGGGLRATALLQEHVGRAKMLDRVGADDHRLPQLQIGHRQRFAGIQVVVTPRSERISRGAPLHVRAIVDADDVEPRMKSCELRPVTGADVDDSAARSHSPIQPASA